MNAEQQPIQPSQQPVHSGQQQPTKDNQQPKQAHQQQPKQAHQQQPDQMRGHIIVRTSIIGIVVNVVLAAFKAVVGLAANSIAMVLDAVNNLTDALSSIITILGTKLASRAPDRKHPLGHGRYEYLTAVVITGIVGYAGISSLVESVKKVIWPSNPDFDTVALVVISVAVVAKIVLGRFVQAKGKQANSSALEASGKDALFDAAISAGVLLAAIIFVASGVNIEAYVGVLIALVILKAALDMLRDTLDDIIGTRPSPELSRGIKATVCQDEQVLGAFDLLVESYGPNQTIAQIHVEVPDTLTAADIDAMTRRLQARVMEEHGVVLSTVGIYSRNTDDELADMRRQITQMVMAHEGVLQIHGFYADKQSKTATFDVIIDFEHANRNELYRHITSRAHEMYPDYDFRVVLDADLSD